MGAVVAALELGYLVPAGEGAGGADSHHCAFRAGVGEPDGVQGGDAVAEQFRQAHLRLGGAAERVAARRLALERVHDVGVGVAEYVGGGVDHKVKVAVAVNVIDIVALRAVDEGGIGGEVRRAARAAAGQVLVRLALERLGFGRGCDKAVGFAAELGCWHCAAPC